MTPKTRRRVYRVRWDPLGWWYVSDSEGFAGGGRPRQKARAVAVARAVARQHHAAGGLAQVRVYGKNGRIQTEWTYGRDPKRTRG